MRSELIKQSGIEKIRKIFKYRPQGRPFVDKK
jgi:hypothetical protein